MSRTLLRLTLLSVAGIVPVGAAHAEQFTFLDMKYTATEQNSNIPTRGHYDIRDGGAVKLTQPANWTSPIDYTKGTVVVELDSIEKPSAELAQIDICFLTSKGYGCRNTTKYTTPGRYQLVRPMPTGFNDYDKIDWTKPITHVQLVTKDGANNNGGTDLKKFFPHTTRIAVTFVAPGSTYVLPPGWTAAPGADAGVGTGSDAGAADVGGSGAGDANAPTADAQTPVTGAGGAGGSNGAGGAAGAGGAGGVTSNGGSGGTPSQPGSGGSAGAGVAGGSSGATATGGTSSTSGAGGATKPPASSSKASGCSTATGAPPPISGVLALFTYAGLGLALRRRRRRTTSTQ
jgi:MYXO-CTERM domain-containing protein